MTIMNIRPIGIIVAIAVIMVIVLAYSGEIPIPAFTPIKESQIQEVKRLCTNIRIPDSFRKITENGFSKTFSASYLLQFKSADKLGEFDQSFINSFINDGWVFSDESGEGQRRLNFIKDRYSVGFEYPEIYFSDERLFSITCSWGTR